MNRHAVLDARQLNRATLARQLLLARESTPVAVPVAVPDAVPDAVADAVARLGGLQAQEPRPPFIGLWSRLADFAPEALVRTLTERAVVRATLMRGTLHLATAADYVDWRPSLQPVLTRGMTGALRERAAGLDPELVLPVARALLERQPHSFDDLRALLQQEFPDVNHRALGFSVRMLLPLVMVPSDDRWGFPRVADFTLADRWLGRAIDGPVEPDGLVLRHLGAFGPATAADVQAWSGLQGIKAVLDRLRPRLVTFADDRGRELFDLPEAPRPDAGMPAPARYLPEFDNLLLAHADRRRVIADEHRPVVITKNLRVRATFLLDGFVAGVWEIKRTRRAASLKLTPLRPLSQDEAAELHAEGEALARVTDPDASAHEVVVG
jgi:hypothetical protein